MASSSSSTNTNGASLEDCRTNVFVLTELIGLKWRRYVAAASDAAAAGDLAADPILRAYTRALADGLLCVWRRIAPQRDKLNVPDPKVEVRLDSPKELWIFWYGDEPGCLATFKPSLSVAETCENQWDATFSMGGGGVDYETRTLIFKALHNLIERCLMNKGFIRLGRWFTQALDSSIEQNAPSYIMAFRFSFFIHGDMNVCVTVDAQRQPPVYKLARKHLDHSSSSAKPVLLAPWCLNGSLCPSTSATSVNGSISNQQYKEWTQFYPSLQSIDDNMENLGYVDPAEEERKERLRALEVPRMVTVKVAGIQMFYPSQFVLATADSLPSSSDTSSDTAADSKQKSSPLKRQAATSTSDQPTVNRWNHPIPTEKFVQRAVEELICTRKAGCSSTGDNTPTSSAPLSASTSTDNLTSFAGDEGVHWPYCDLNSREHCGCKPVVPAGAVPSKAALKFGASVGQQRVRDKQMRLSKSGAFHRRSPLTVRAESAAAIGASSGNAGADANYRHPYNSNPTGAHLSGSTGGFPGGSGKMLPVMPPISVSNLPPHEPITQMISPAAPVSTVSSVATAFPSTTTVKQENCADVEKPSIGNCKHGHAVQVVESKDDVVQRNHVPPIVVRPKPVGDSTTILIRSLKRPKLSALDPKFVALELSEYLQCDMLYKDNNFRGALSQLVEKISGDDGLDRVGSLKRKHDEIGGGVPTVAANSLHEKTSPEGATSQQEDADGEATKQGLSAIELKPAVTLPEDFMDVQNTSPSTSFISPPASNEANDQNQHARTPLTFRLTAGTDTVRYGSHLATTATARPSTAHDTGNAPLPPTIDCYPTPPSAEPFNHAQFSPSDHQATSSVTITVTDSAAITTTSAVHSTALSTARKLHPSLTVGISSMNGFSVLTRPLAAPFPSSSKFYGNFQTRSTQIAAEWTAKSHRSAIQTLRYVPTRSVSISGLNCYQQAAPTSSVASTSSGFRPSLATSTSQPASHFVRQHSGMAASPYQAHLDSPVGSAGGGVQRPQSVTSMRGGPRTPAIQQMISASDIQSPLSNRNINSIDNQYNSAGGGGCGAPEAHGLVLSVLLCDSFIDLHHDSSFDSCPMCICNGNIRGWQIGTYLSAADTSSGNTLAGPPSKFQCTCGFSAVQYRQLSYQSGLFLEDESEIVGFTRTNLDPNARSVVYNAQLVELIRKMSLRHDLSTTIYDAIALRRRIDNRLPVINGRRQQLTCNGAMEVFNKDANMAQYDSNFFAAQYFIHRPTWMAFKFSPSSLSNQLIEASCQAMDCTVPNRSDIASRLNEKGTLVAFWGYQQAAKLQEPKDHEWLSIVDQLYPVIKGAVDNFRSVSSNPRDEGALTWRQFARKSFRVPTATDGHEEDCQPEPIPQLLVSAEGEQLSITPQAVRLWDRLLLEPFTQPKDVVYVGVIPENSFVRDRAAVFFKELSRTYQNCRFGRHTPFSGYQDGLMRVGPKTLRECVGDPDEWFQRQAIDLERRGQRALADQLKSYAMIFKHLLADVLNVGQIHDRASMFRGGDAVGKENQQPSSSSSVGGISSSSTLNDMPPPKTPEDSSASTSQVTSDSGGDHSTGGASVGGGGVDGETDTLPHAVVLYVVSPFLSAPDSQQYELAKIALEALLRCYLSFLRNVPDRWRSNVQLEIISLRTLFECTSSAPGVTFDGDDATGGAFVLGDNGANTEMRQSQRLNTWDQLRSTALSVYNHARTLTAHCLLSVQAKSLTNFGPAAERFMLIQKQIHALQKGDDATKTFSIRCTPYLLAPSYRRGATAAGNLGELISSSAPSSDENTLFVSYCLTDNQRFLLATSTDQLGHTLDNTVIGLSLKPGISREQVKKGQLIRESLQRLWSFIVKQIKQGCKPWRLVIGRVGRFGHGELRVWSLLLSRSYLRMTNQKIAECAQCSQMPGYQETPTLLSACLVSLEPEPHLRVFPSSFVHDERFGKVAKRCPLSTPEDASCTHILVFPTSASLSSAPLSEDKGDDLFDNIDIQMPSDIGLGDLADLTDGRHNPRPSVSNTFAADTFDLALDQQPLAVGFYISTGKADGLPNWFWANCPAARGRRPVHLKSSLHWNIPSLYQQEDLGTTLGQKKKVDRQHPLDSNQTIDVLRYVLDSYNALSWLDVDMSSGDRRSCLPVHIQALLRLYHGVSLLLAD